MSEKVIAPTKVKICDALPGFGKTTAAEHMINNSNKRYIFITPYTSETEELRDACIEREFELPDKVYDVEKGHKTKLEGLHRLLEKKKNIASTHSLFSHYTQKTMDLIQRGRYTLIMDETVEVLEQINITPGEAEFFVSKGGIKVDAKTNEAVWNYEEYKGGTFDGARVQAKKRNLFYIGNVFYSWLISAEVFRCFQEVYVMTYMFQHSILRAFFEMNKIGYDYIGVKCVGINHETNRKMFEFCPMEEMDRTRDLRPLINIFDNEKLNAVGDEYFSFSTSWFDDLFSRHETVKTIKNNLTNFFRHYHPVGRTEKMWTCVQKFFDWIKGQGYARSFVSFCQKATDEYKHKKTLANCTNTFVNPALNSFMVKRGANPINNEMYALGIIVQWLFRSAIRNCEEVWLYVPSMRMRALLKRWMDNLAVGRDLDLIELKEEEFKIAKQKRQRVVA